MTTANDVSHGDLLLAIGQMQGKIDALVATMSQQRSDVSEALRRINEAEKRIAQGVILCVTMSIVIPVAVIAVQPQLQQRQHVQTDQSR